MLSKGTTEDKFRLWTENPYFDKDMREELLRIKDQSEIEDRFYTDLEFGTGGMRGVLGAGTNRMNKYVIRKLSQGLAETITDHGDEACKRGVVIAYDSRRYSAEFALETALTLAANNVKVFLFESLRPTPELSFAVRFLKTTAGVNITASHNPKDYNGYKVYWEDGGQIPPSNAVQMIEKIAGLESWEIRTIAESQARESGLLVNVGQDVDRAYYQEIKKHLLFPELCKTQGKKLKVVFTPLHGTGGRLVKTILEESCFSVFIVPEQEKPDTEFTTVKSPNPEDPAAFEIALKYAQDQQADIILATDPDADRLGLYAKGRRGEYKRFTGNQIGVLLEYYLLSQKKRLGTLADNAVIVKTVASTDLGDALAERFGVKVVNVLVGFKYIGEQIKDMEENGWGTYIFGFEESHGYLAGTYARDKDAVQAAALLSEAALYYHEEEGKTLTEVLDEIFQLCGYYQDEQVAVALKGKEGKEQIVKIMERLRSEKRLEFGGVKVRSIEDFQTDTRRLLSENTAERIGLPKENVIRFSFEGGGFIMARPSGTEPKIRFYFCIRGNALESVAITMEKVKEAFFSEIKDLIQT